MDRCRKQLKNIKPQDWFVSITNIGMFIKNKTDLDVVVSGPEVGLSILASKNLREVYSFGHFEYDRDTLAAWEAMNVPLMVSLLSEEPSTGSCIIIEQPVDSLTEFMCLPSLPMTFPTNFSSMNISCCTKFINKWLPGAGLITGPSKTVTLGITKFG